MKHTCNKCSAPTNMSPIQCDECILIEELTHFIAQDTTRVEQMERDMLDAAERMSVAREALRQDRSELRSMIDRQRERRFKYEQRGINETNQTN